MGDIPDDFCCGAIAGDDKAQASIWLLCDWRAWGVAEATGPSPQAGTENLRPPEPWGLGAWLTLGFKCSQPKAGGRGSHLPSRTGIKAALSE